MSIEAPSKIELQTLLGREAYRAWTETENFIRSHYNAEEVWDKGRKAGIYECKFRRGGKTLCSLFAREKSFGFMMIFGKAEREKFESSRENFPQHIQDVYDRTKTFHDGKWMMFDETDGGNADSFRKLLFIKKKPDHLKEKNPTEQ